MAVTVAVRLAAVPHLLLLIFLQLMACVWLFVFIILYRCNNVTESAFPQLLSHTSNTLLQAARKPEQDRSPGSAGIQLPAAPLCSEHLCCNAL